MKDTQKISLWFGGAVLLAGLLMLSVFSLYRKIGEADGWRTHTYRVLRTAENLLSIMKDAETGQRGYLLTGNEAYLEPYLSVRDNFASELARLHQLTQTVPLQQQRIAVLGKLSDAKLANLKQTIELRRRGDQEAALQVMRSGQGKRLMDEFRLEIGRFITLEDELLAQRDASYAASRRNMLALIATLGVFGVMVAAAAAYAMFREMQLRLLRQQQFTLMVEQKNAELEHMTAKLLEDDEQMQVQHRKTLEARERM
ncbi:MAG: CHASE3 domain-containing protein, partial [Sideroxyarcus sp.]|nr:CHASE3 domain-containing protein [Sideroxyarcus sp.]